MSDSIDRRAGSWQRAAPWVAPTLLALVALTQIVLVHTTELTAWKGGGFGMFSTVERPETRVLRCWIVAGDRRRLIAIPASVRSHELRARSMPTRRNLEALATALVRQAKSPVSPASALQIEVWHRELDLTTGTVQLEFRTRVEIPWSAS